jgi:hypothetical protein
MQAFINWFGCLFIRLMRALLGKGPSINCWMLANPNVADCVKWQFQASGNAYDVPDSNKLPYNNWSSQQKNHLQKAFDQAWAWHHTNSPLHNLQETLDYPPKNLHTSIANDNSDPYTAVSDSWAWDLYTRYIAHQLLVEIKKLVPWSVKTYDSTALHALFDSTSICSRSFFPTTQFSIGAGAPWNLNFVHRKDNLGASLIAPPRYTYAFLYNNNLIGADRLQTIGKLLNWCRDNMAHFFGASNYKNMEEHWQYRGLTPITRIIEGTTYPGTNQFMHWTAGCHGTTGFLKNVLRSINIPMHIQRICGHSVGVFFTEGRYLDHGDDPYNSTFKGTGLPAIQLLIDDATFTSWFGNNPDNHENGCDKIGNQVNVLAEN